MVVNQGEIYQANTDIYSRDEFFPTQPVELVVSGMIRSQRVARLSFSPFQYNPVTQVVRFVTQYRNRSTAWKK